ncbi:hypothetical protein [Haloplanus salilacus]|uniref:hypothetical protein n=1 Tax=Haloplanus salilacus TaxID=2949994 RepID=UPI0030D4AA22
MSFRGDDRGVSEVVGFVLVLGILVLLLTINQAQIVPADNRATATRTTSSRSTRRSRRPVPTP